jgi:serine/threonine-protein phosphatase 4 regulatory subunit 1
MHELPSFLQQILPLEAVDYVLPLLSQLAMDPGGSLGPCCKISCQNIKHLYHVFTEEQVKEALAAKLVPIIWWFFSVCPPALSASYQSSDQFHSVAKLSKTIYPHNRSTMM